MVLVSASLAAACGGSTSQDSSTGGSGGGGAVAGGGMGGGGAVAGGGTGGGGAVAGGGSGGTPSCESFADETPPGAITVRLKNTKPYPIYVGGGTDCGGKPLFTLSDAGGPVQMFAGGCGNTCEKLQKHGDWCPDACMIPPVVMIQPGGHYDDVWSGTTFEELKMPKSCYFEPEFAGASCSRRIVAPAGAYAALAVGGTAVTCLDVGICSCKPDANGACEIMYGGDVSGDPVPGKVAFQLPGASLVVIEL
jgi:hypothetical protein